VLATMQPALLTRPWKFCGDRMEDVLNLETLFALFFLLWWVVGACILTYLGPFKVTSNGYFSCWAAFGASIRLFNATLNGAPADLLSRKSGHNGGAGEKSKAAVASMIGWSVVLLIASLHVVGGSTPDAHTKRGPAVFAIVVSVVTIRDAVFLLTMNSLDFTRKAGAILLVVLWLATVIVTTIPYNMTFAAAGNGFFAVWLGLVSCVWLALEETQRRLAASVYFNATAVYTAAGLLIWVETCQFLNAPPGRLRSLAGFAFAYGMLTFLFGAFLLDLMLIREDKRMFYHIPKLKPCLKRTATWLFDGPSITFLDIKITPLRCVAVVLTAFAIAAALGLTYYFDPYTHVDDGYLACWISVIAAAFLISQDTPPLPPPPTPESLATVTTISSDEEAAELGVPSAAEAAGEKGSEEPSHTPLEEPSAKEEPPPLAAPPIVTMLGLASGLLIIAAAHMLSVLGVDDADAGVVVANAASPCSLGIAFGIRNVTGECVWAIVVGSVTLAAILMRAVLLYTRLIDSPLGIWWWRVIVAGLLALMWLSAALALTFVGPFLDTGNGYFAAWAGMICATALLLQETSTPVEGYPE